MENVEDSFNQRIYDQMFGKLSLRKFLEFGSFRNNLEEKKLLIEFIRKYLTKQNNINCFYNIKDFIVFLSERKEEFERLKLKSINSFSNTTPIITKQFEETTKKTFYIKESIGYNDDEISSAETCNFFFNKFSKLGVNQKYIDHWDWLRRYFGERSVIFLSFHDLIMESFKIDESVIQ